MGDNRGVVQDSDGTGKLAGLYSAEDHRFVALAEATLDDYLVRNPTVATAVGDHRFDHRIGDLSSDGVAEQVRILTGHLGRLETVESWTLSRVNTIDLQILRDQVAARISNLTELAEQTWNPLRWNPGELLYPLLARPDSDPDIHGHSITCRLGGLPEFLDAARVTLKDMPRPHVQTAADQLDGFQTLLARILAEPQRLGSHEAAVRDAAEDAAVAVHDYGRWLRGQVPSSQRDPRLGPKLYSRVLQDRTGYQGDPDELLVAAEAELAELHERIARVAARVLKRSMATRRLVPTAMAEVADLGRVPVGELPRAAVAAMQAAIEFTKSAGLITVPQIPIDVIDMPVFRRGVAMAYCDPPGALAPAQAPTYIAISPAESSWSPVRRDSFYREYNAAMLDVLMIHEAVPGHALQLHAARAAQTPSRVRDVFQSGSFIEGWAVYAESMMVDAGFQGASASLGADAIRLQQLKMALRSVVNTILDIRFHTREMTQAQARRLLAVDGFQEEGEVAAKWRRVQVTAGQLPQYFVGGSQVRSLVAELAESKPHWPLRRMHDEVLSHGSVDPQYLRTLLALD